MVNRFSRFMPIILVAFFALLSCNDFAGANSYFLYAVSDTDRAAVLDAMRDADMKLLRIFITRVEGGAKGSSAVPVNDLETVAVGQYDPTILGLIDELAYEAHMRDIKLIIAMHDRYSLGCWQSDGYVAKYNLPTTSDCQNDVPDSSAFYTQATTDFDKRLSYILNFQSTRFGVPWHQLSDAIFAFEIQNEAMGHMDIVALNWWCDRATTIRGILGGTGIQISTGGGVDLTSSLGSQFFSCSNIQIIALHDYSINTSYIASQIDGAKPTAAQSQKRLLYEEFGAMGGDKQNEINSVLNTLVSTGVPWMYWELTKPGMGASAYEVWTDEPSWSTIASQSQLTRQHVGQFGWNEIDGGT